MESIVLFILMLMALKRKGDNSERLQKYLSSNIRNDIRGKGHFGAPRGQRTHNGTDYIIKPQQAIYSPVKGLVKRIAFPYANDNIFKGLVIEQGETEVKIFYFEPLKNIVGKEVAQGELIGYAQDIRKKYPLLTGMIPHIHVELRENGILKDFDKNYNNG